MINQNIQIEVSGKNQTSKTDTTFPKNKSKAIWLAGFPKNA